MMDTDDTRWRHRYRNLSQNMLASPHGFVYRGIITPVTNKHLLVKSSGSVWFFSLFWVEEVTIGCCLASDCEGESIVTQGAHFDIADGAFQGASSIVAKRYEYICTVQYSMI
jgi:hypothetical protein